MNESNNRAENRLSDEEFENVANRAAEIVEFRLYANVGRAILTKIVRFGGTGLLAVVVWEIAKALGLKPERVLPIFFGG